MRDKHHLIHNGYSASVAWSEEDECYVGYLDDIAPAVCSFHGDTTEELLEAFIEAVGDWQETKRGEDGDG